MSGLAMFSLKVPSRLQFDRNRNEKTVRHTHRVRNPAGPCDDSLCERFDNVNPRSNGRERHFCGVTDTADSRIDPDGIDAGRPFPMEDRERNLPYTEG